MSQIWKKSRANKHTQNESTAPKTKKSFFHLNDYRTKARVLLLFNRECQVPRSPLRHNFCRFPFKSRRIFITSKTVSEHSFGVFALLLCESFSLEFQNV